jgi:hypothetical protein
MQPRASQAGMSAPGRVSSNPALLKGIFTSYFLSRFLEAPVPRLVRFPGAGTQGQVGGHQGFVSEVRKVANIKDKISGHQVRLEGDIILDFAGDLRSKVRISKRKV